MLGRLSIDAFSQWLAAWQKSNQCKLIVPFPFARLAGWRRVAERTRPNEIERCWIF